MAHLDLDKIHAAEREAAGEPPTVKLGGKTYELPVKLPLAASVASRQRDWRKLAGILFNEKNADKVLLVLEPEDVDRIAENLYGLGAGNSEPSAG